VLNRQCFPHEGREEKGSGKNKKRSPFSCVFARAFLCQDLLVLFFLIYLTLLLCAKTGDFDGIRVKLLSDWVTYKLEYFQDKRIKNPLQKQPDSCRSMRCITENQWFTFFPLAEIRIL